jgi:hypothetical protein
MREAARGDGRPQAQQSRASFAPAADGGRTAGGGRLEPDDPRRRPAYWRFGPDSIRYASNGATYEDPACGGSWADSRSGTFYGTGVHRASEVPCGDRMASGDGLARDGGAPGSGGLIDRPGMHEMPDWEEAPGGGSRRLEESADEAWYLPEPEPGWFGRHRPDLWVLGGGTLVAAAALVAAFAASSGAMATGHAQTTPATSTQAQTSRGGATQAGTTPSTRPICVFSASSAANR